MKLSECNDEWLIENQTHSHIYHISHDQIFWNISQYFIWKLDAPVKLFIKNELSFPIRDQIVQRILFAMVEQINE